jgi:hypothetical protein
LWSYLRHIAARWTLIVASVKFRLWRRRRNSNDIIIIIIIISFVVAIIVGVISKIMRCFPDRRLLSPFDLLREGTFYIRNMYQWTAREREIFTQWLTPVNKIK